MAILDSVSAQKYDLRYLDVDYMIIYFVQLHSFTHLKGVTLF